MQARLVDIPSEAFVHGSFTMVFDIFGHTLAQIYFLQSKLGRRKGLKILQEEKVSFFR